MTLGLTLHVCPHNPPVLVSNGWFLTAGLLLVVAAGRQGVSDGGRLCRGDEEGDEQAAEGFEWVEGKELCTTAARAATDGALPPLPHTHVLLRTLCPNLLPYPYHPLSVCL